jgi:hypothetical protein
LICVGISALMDGNHYGTWTVVIYFAMIGFFWFIHRDLSDTDAKTGFVFCGAIALIVQYCTILFFATFVNASDPSLDSSPIGKSSCSPETEQLDIPYNPWGWQRSTLNQIHFLHCPFVGGRWADITGIAPNVYPASVLDPLVPNISLSTCNGQVGCADLLTTRREDYFDRGMGLTHGWTKGATIDDGQTTCPLVDESAWNGQRSGRGRPICGFCSAYLAKYHGYTEWEGPELCPGDVDDPFCFICRYTWNQTLNQRKFTVYVLIGSFVLNTFLVAARGFYANWKKASRKSGN